MSLCNAGWEDERRVQESLDDCANVPLLDVNLPGTKAARQEPGNGRFNPLCAALA